MKNYSISSQINKTPDCYGTSPSIDIPVLIKQLVATSGFIRMQAREILICLGPPAVPELIASLTADDPQLKWQVIKVIEGIKDIRAVPALVNCLKDDNAGVRWAASEAIITFRRAAIPILLEALVHESDSLWLRQGAHHILHVMKDAGRLNRSEEEVYKALEEVEPSISVPWAAEKALEIIIEKKDSSHQT